MKRQHMRIVYITTAFPRYEGDPIAPWLVESIKRLKKQGIEGEVFTSSYKGHVNQGVDGIKFKRFRYFLKKWEKLTHEETVPDRLKRGILYKILVLFYIVGGLIGIMKLCSRRSYDIIHVHWPFPHAIFGYLAKKLCNAKMVSSFHGVGLRWVKNKMPFFIPFLKWAINQSDAVTANSTYTAKEINEITDKKVIIIPFGAVIVRNQKRLKARNQHTESNVLFVGRLVERKGVKYLIEALDTYLHEYNTCSPMLTIVGDGPERKKLEKLAESKHLQDKIVFKGRVSTDEVDRYYQGCDVFVLPACIDSKNDTEGLGVVLLEAMSYKKPVIASNVGGIVDIIKDGETGLLVPEKNHKELAKAMLKIFSDKVTAVKLGNKGYDFVESNFSWEGITNKLSELYSTISY